MKYRHHQVDGVQMVVITRSFTRAKLEISAAGIKFISRRSSKPGRFLLLIIHDLRPTAALNSAQ